MLVSLTQACVKLAQYQYFYNSTEVGWGKSLIRELPLFALLFQVGPQSALSSSLAADQGDACSPMEMSTSGTLAIEAPPPPKPPSSIEDNVSSKEIEEKNEEESVKGEVEGSLENFPKQATSSLLKPRVDDESGGTTTSSEIEVISTCTSVYDDSVSHQNT